VVKDVVMSLYIFWRETFLAQHARRASKSAAIAEEQLSTDRTGVLEGHKYTLLLGTLAKEELSSRK
jgi:hypothetical protein